MALTLIATPGAVDANAYCTRAEATAYHEAHLYASAWTGATSAQQDAAIAMATRLLDAMVEWSGSKATEAQALPWPRYGMVDRGGYSIDSDVIPTDLKAATAEFARQLLAADRSADSDVETQGLTALTAGPVSLSFKDGVAAKVIPDAVFYLVSHWGAIRQRGGLTQMRLVRA